MLEIYGRQAVLCVGRQNFEVDGASRPPPKTRRGRVCWCSVAPAEVGGGCVGNFLTVGPRRRDEPRIGGLRPGPGA